MAAAVAVLTLLPIADASAASRVCRQLEAQLAAAVDGRGAKSSGQARKYDKAIDRQRKQLSIARGQARNAGCSFSVFSRNVRQCAGLNATISRMERNLVSLERNRGKMGSGEKRSGRSRARILASLDANGCRKDGGEKLAVKRPREDLGSDKRRKSLLDQLLGGSTRRVEPAPEQRLVRLDPETGEPVRRVKRVINDNGQRAGTLAAVQTFATMCVRTCDGYFFPMSPSSTVSDFDRDEKNCQAACPGADLEVFYRPAESPEEVEMTSASTGRPYSQLTTAYLYKSVAEPRPASCGCNVAKNFEVVAGTPPAETVREPESESTAALPGTVPLPQEGPIRESPSITLLPPATAAVEEPVNRDQVAVDDRREYDPSTDAPAIDPARKVRVVGPVFLPDQEAAIDLRVPAPTQVP